MLKNEGSSLKAGQVGGSLAVKSSTKLQPGVLKSNVTNIKR